MSYQADGKNKLKRIEFVFKGKSYKFILNPEEMQQTQPNRVTVTQTKAGAFLDEFGAGVPQIVIKGTTGFKNGSKDPNSGFNKFIELKNLIGNVMGRVHAGQVISASDELYYYNYTDEQYWVTTPIQFDLIRSVARPLMYEYNLQLICERATSNPNYSRKSSKKSITTHRRLTK